jgi:hypothetical protein
MMALACGGEAPVVSPVVVSRPNNCDADDHRNGNQTC